MPDHTAAAGIKNAMLKPKNAIRNLVRIFLTPFRDNPMRQPERLCKKNTGCGFSLPGIKKGISAVSDFTSGIPGVTSAYCRFRGGEKFRSGKPGPRRFTGRYISGSPYKKVGRLISSLLTHLLNFVTWSVCWSASR
jgi:hypothetical protein